MGATTVSYEPHGQSAMTTKILYGLIILTSALLAVANITLQEYVIAGVAIVSGAIWLLLQINQKEPPHSLFFVLFLGLTLLGSLRNIPLPFMLLALTSDLAAWDLSLFTGELSMKTQAPQKHYWNSNIFRNLQSRLRLGLWWLCYRYLFIFR